MNKKIETTELEKMVNETKQTEETARFSPLIVYMFTISTAIIVGGWLIIKFYTDYLYQNGILMWAPAIIGAIALPPSIFGLIKIFKLIDNEVR